jgi:hypothetical protein
MPTTRRSLVYDQAKVMQVSKETKLYTVSLPMNVVASDPHEAIDNYIEQIVMHGLRPWHFTVHTSSADAESLRGIRPEVTEDGNDQAPPAE